MPPAPARCQALTKAGRQCSLTSASSLLDPAGKPVAGPLRRGGDKCLFHATWFSSQPAFETCFLLCYVDLETTGLSMQVSEIVEIAALVADTGAVFSTVVRPPELPKDVGVHGICPAELKEGPTFLEALRRLTSFLDGLCDIALSDDDGSSEDDAGPRLRSEQPCILMAAHNGLGFDYPLLASVCWRHGLDTFGPLVGWRYVDTLTVLRAVGPELAGGCMKLQCQRSARGLQAGACAHRALDDVRVLKDLMDGVAAGLGVPTASLLARFAVKLDAKATAASLSVLLEGP
jgi:DNA polymerase III epsilon subunit-like protein